MLLLQHCEAPLTSALWYQGLVHGTAGEAVESETSSYLKDTVDATAAAHHVVCCCISPFNTHQH